MAASGHGVLTIIKNGEPLKRVQLQGIFPLVRFINGEIITAARYGKLTVLNKKLDFLKTFPGTERGLYTLTANKKFIAMGDYSGTVRYYDRAGSTIPRVSSCCRHSNLSIDLPS